MTRKLPIALAIALAGGLTGPHSASGLSAENFNAQVAITSDYVFRGISQTRGDPAVQGGFDFRHASGFFAGIWGSSVDFPSNRGRAKPRTLELDYFVGFELVLGDSWSGVVELIRYDYPGAGSGFDYSYNEVDLSWVFRERLEAAVAYTDDFLGFDSSSLHYELVGVWPLPFELELKGGLGYADLDRALGKSYPYWSLGIARRLGHFVVDLGWFDTGTAARELWGELADGRLVLTLSASVR